MRFRTLAIAATLAAGTTASMAIDVAICAAAGSAGAGQFTDPQAKLIGTGLFTSVDIIHAGAVTPTLAELQNYDAVIVWSNTNFLNAAALGDVLADYVDAGGGVVVTVFANSTLTNNRFLTGRWQAQADSYEVIPAVLGTTSGSLATLGNILVPGHPIMQGVNTFSGGTSSFRPTTLTLRPGATKVAEWSDGRTLVAVGANPRRVDLGMYPPSSGFSATFWDQTTDGARLMANALLFVATSTPRVSGFADLEGYVGDTTGGNLIVQVWQFGNLVETLNANYGANGAYTCSPTVNGAATLKFKFHTGLYRAVNVVLSGTPLQNVNALMFNGDCDNDNEVTIGDYAILSISFGSNQGDPNYLDNADLNGDESVDIGDFALLSNNFNMAGD